jgi:RNA polymerase sigma-54 factor
LTEQLNALQIDNRSKVIAEYIIGNLDENGWLTQQDSLSIAKELLLQEQFYSSKEEVESVISNIVQQLDPPGVAARTLQESLLLQLKRKPQDNINILAINIIENYFEEFSKKHREQLLKLLKVEEEALQQATKVISRLNPFPNSNPDEALNNNRYIIPDFILTREGDDLILSLNNEFIPKLKIDDFFEIQYRKIKDNSPKEDDIYIKEAVESARSFITMLEQRDKTLITAMTHILLLQKDFFMTGDKSLIKPMILKDIAERTGLSESTISRISNGKYVRTECGDFFLKSLFSEGVGDKNISSIAIKNLLSELIEHEDPKKPLTDQQLCELLKAQNNSIERRTVAKYREDLGIPVYRLRKRN